jgi:hypothetical protein
LKEAENKIKNLMTPFETKIFEQLNISYDTKYKFPWNRLFEVEIELN